MCGILGIIKLKKQNATFRKSLRLMDHRGPDFSGEYVNQSVYLGHNRLSILDLNKRANQPLHIDDYRIIFNGEVYNYKELINEYYLKVTTSSDTEVILLMYIKFGPKCLNFFNGMFSLIIYNEKNDEIFIARDRLGIKPLYYKKIGDETIFSSEIASILNIYPDEYDEFGIRQYSKLRMTINGYTIYKNIKVFPPGHYWLNGKTVRYWDLDVQSKDPPDDDELLWLINDAVELRKRSDVPVGSYLSGGLDSTILTYILKPQNTWTVGFNKMNEFKWSEIANEGLNTIHHKTIIDKDSFIETAKWMISKRKEPLSVPNEVLLYLMTKNVKRKNTVILSGEGADELFLGYDRIFNWAYEAKSLNINEFDEKYSYGTHKDNEVLDFALEGLPGLSVFDKISYFFQVHHLNGLLRRLDNSTMLCSVEARVPFVDHRLVELIAGTPFSWRMGSSIKEPLKRIYKDLIPHEIINREKIGFPVPLESIFFHRNDNKNPMDSWLKFNMAELQD